MSPQTRAITCQRCGFLALRSCSTTAAARLAVEHLTAAGCPADQILIQPLAVGR